MKPTVETCDVAVIGGGSAGLAAAVAAARSGARTVLIERHGQLGGMGTSALVHTFCGLYLLREEPGAVIANPGIASEIESLMQRATGVGPVRMGRVDVLPQHPVEFAHIADQLVSSEQTLDCWFHSEVVAVHAEEKWEIDIAGRGGLLRLRASSLVDASGDAVVARMLGEKTEMSESPVLQRPAYIFGIRCPGSLTEETRLHTAGAIVSGIRAGDLPPECMGVSFRSSGRRDEHYGTLDLQADMMGAYDPLDTRCLSEVERKGRELASRIVSYLNDHSDFWRNAYISQWPQRAGVRESRRWIGEQVLTGKELLQGTRFPDEIALATWPMEFRENAKGAKLRFPDGNRPTGIPLGCLKPLGIPNLFVAGRCISVDHDAQASIRVMGTCFATGEAAGREAANAAI